jgi:hypothetical protein
MSSLWASITGATAAIAEFPQIELPQAIRTDSLVGRPSMRLTPKLSASMIATVPAIAPISARPEAAIAAKLIEAPSSTTATSSSCLALKAMPERHRSDGFQAVRIAIPSRIAMTRAST